MRVFVLVLFFFEKTTAMEIMAGSTGKLLLGQAARRAASCGRVLEWLDLFVCFCLPIWPFRDCAVQPLHVTVLCHGKWQTLAEVAFFSDN